MLDNKLIESALQLTGKTMYDVSEKLGYTLSMPMFCYYLLSPEFIEKYREIRFKNLDKNTIDCIVILNKNGTIVSDIGEAIRDYQSGNEEPLIQLLSKIK